MGFFKVVIGGEMSWSSLSRNLNPMWVPVNVPVIGFAVASASKNRGGVVAFCGGDSLLGKDESLRKELSIKRCSH